jgi:hypothetical protein
MVKYGWTFPKTGPQCEEPSKREDPKQLALRSQEMSVPAPQAPTAAQAPREAFYEEEQVEKVLDHHPFF